jgi:ATP-dependent helicase/nuclease subunit A
LAAGAGDASDRLRGTLVHRLLQRLGLPDDAPADVGVDAPGLHGQSLEDLVARLAEREESPEAIDPSLVGDVVAMFRAVCRRDDVRRLYALGQAWHEVPFALLSEGRLVRGTIDCLIHAGDRVIILEFKTGRRRAVHDEQVALYRLAAAAIFPEARIDAHVIYSHEGAA